MRSFPIILALLAVVAHCENSFAQWNPFEELRKGVEGAFGGANIPPINKVFPGGPMKFDLPPLPNFQPPKLPNFQPLTLPGIKPPAGLGLPLPGGKLKPPTLSDFPGSLRRPQTPKRDDIFQASATAEWKYRASVPDGYRLINLSIRDMAYDTATNRLRFRVTGSVPFRLDGSAKVRNVVSSSLTATADVDYDIFGYVAFDLTRGQLAISPGVTDVNAEVRNLRFNNDLANTVRGAAGRRFNQSIQDNRSNIRDMVNQSLAELNQSYDGGSPLQLLASRLREVQGTNRQVDLRDVGAAIGGVLEERVKQKFATLVVEGDGSSNIIQYRPPFPRS